MFLNKKPESVTKNDVEFLIDKCIRIIRSSSYAQELDKLALLKDASLQIQLVTPSTDQLDWIPEHHPKRLEAFLRRTLDYVPIEIDGCSNKTQFKLNYIVQCAIYPNNITLKRLEEYWKKLKNINEFSNLTIPDEEDFIEYFSKSYKEWIKEQDVFYKSKKMISEEIYTTEEALVWLDNYSFDYKSKKNSDSRSLLSLLVRQIHKSWKQKYDRKHSRNIQKNFSIPQSTNKKLEELSTKYRVSQTEIISILIDNEYKKATRLKRNYSINLINNR